MLRLAEIESRHKVSAPFKGESLPEKQYNIVREDRAYLLAEVERLRKVVTVVAATLPHLGGSERGTFSLLQDCEAVLVGAETKST